ncbi:MAG: hypothetical protein EHM72_16925 [Calditrichaeota bacterium]|nr:MAG: hypothetical protein EHM72_16925 [Calditrichota bacterium]
MKRSMMVTLMMLLILSCVRDKKITAPIGEDVFALYLVANEQELMDSAKSHLTLDDLVPEAVPFFTVFDLEFYQWSSHAFKLRHNCCPKYIDLNQYHLFLVVVGTERIYWGEFVLDIMSRSVDRPVLHLMPPQSPVVATLFLFPCENRFAASYPEGLAEPANDSRSDERIYNALKKAGVLIK